jgi:hypothetical protein
VTLTGSKIDSFEIYYWEKFINLLNQGKIPRGSYEKLP